MILVQLEMEKDLTLLISKYMFDRFRELKVSVKLTRDSDETLDSSERVNRILDGFGNDNNVIVISNHINAGGGGDSHCVTNV